MYVISFVNYGANTQTEDDRDQIYTLETKKKEKKETNDLMFLFLSLFSLSMHDSWR